MKELGLTLGDRKRLAKRLAARTAMHGRALERTQERSQPLPSAASTVIDAERRQLTVMFVDLIDSTGLAERFDPEDMRRLLGSVRTAGGAGSHRSAPLAESVVVADAENG
ncbi:hypothetical protein [Paraburkholderia sp.]|uniref:hypothetical protein n=1 Tax=Paraburkholderia sp. TaxID=1926495 RepID=UPI002AFEAE74|nr:hypothetical protein [Paraburkholderia sp.]